MKETLELQAAAEIQSVREKGQKLEEKRRQKRKIEGAIFLEIILQKSGNTSRENCLTAQ